MILVAIDPGSVTGMAVFRDYTLVSAFFGPPEEMLEIMVGEVTNRAIIEKPKWRPHDKVEIDDLLGVAVIVGEFKQKLSSYGVTAELVWPHTWKGSVPKDIHNDRVLAKLSAVEIACLPKSKRAKKYNHNMVDAVGLGLWKLKRMR